MFRQIVLPIRFSQFGRSDLVVAEGTTVRFVVRNDDPIDHELIVGDQAVQDRHERGTEARHGPVPGEISIPPESVAATVVTFRSPGVVFFGCHLPGHWAYGMHGTIRVTPAH